MQIRAKFGWTAVAVLMAGCPAARAEEHVFESAQTVDTVIGGDDSVRIKCPAGAFVVLTAANTYTGDTIIESGGVTVSNLTALGTGRIKCASGTAVRVAVDYTQKEGGLTAAIIDRIDVASTTNDTEPWVSFQLTGAAGTNDVDFSKQPYLWLGAPQSGAVMYRGTFTPWNNEYHLGYAGKGAVEHSICGLRIGGFTDGPNGESRRVVLRGPGATAIMDKKSTHTGGLDVYGPARLDCVGWTASAFGSSLVLHDGTMLNSKSTNDAYPADLTVTIDGTVRVHLSGATDATLTTFNGPFAGTGTIRLTDQGGVRFVHTNNTFTGNILLDNTHAKNAVEIGFGNGTACSWAGSAIDFRDDVSVLTNQIVVVNCNADVTFNTAVSAKGGRLVKKGTGVLTLAKPYTRKPARDDVPVVDVQGGTVRLGVAPGVPLQGLVRLAATTTLDLNNMPVESLWLPVGSGSIVNVADRKVRFAANLIQDESFRGKVDAVCTVAATGYARWTVDAFTRFDSPLTVESGRIQTMRGFVMDELALGDAGEVQVNRGIGNGLRAEYWMNASGWCAGALDAVTNTMNQTEPTLVLDTESFGDGFDSTRGRGTNIWTNTAEPDAFSDVLGTAPNYFTARFTGFFVADADGDYTFLVQADDHAYVLVDGRLVTSVRNGWQGAGNQGSITLAKGEHAFEVVYADAAGANILRVQVKGPVDAAFAVLPTACLRPVRLADTGVSRVTGTGYLRLADAAVWPDALDLSKFTGTLVADAATVSPSIGTVSPATARLAFFEGNDDLDEDVWAMSGRAQRSYSAGRSFALLGGTAHGWGSLNTRTPFDVSKPFELTFDFSAVAPMGEYAGDGFALVLHKGESNSVSRTFSFNEGQDRIDDANAYGMQFYLYDTANRIAWVKNKRALGGVYTNVYTEAFAMKNLIDSPMRVTMAWDLAKLSVTLAKGQTVWSSEITAATNDIPALFSDGGAYLGIWAKNAGYWTTMRIENLRFVQWDAAGEKPAPAPLCFNGTLALSGGTLTVQATERQQRATLAAALRVAGANVLAAELPDGQTIDCTSTDWTFDLTDAATRLDVGAGFVLPTAPITIGIIGDVPPRKRLLADFSALGEAADALQFELAADAPRTWRRTYADRCLFVSANVGTVIMIR